MAFVWGIDRYIYIYKHREKSPEKISSLRHWCSGLLLKREQGSLLDTGEREKICFSLQTLQTFL